MSREDDRVRIRLAEIMSSAGLGYNQISLEVLYLLPTEFVDAYIALWEKALGPAGMGDRVGTTMARDGQLGKHKTETRLKGERVGAGSGGGGKRFKKFWTIRDEHALAMKNRVDKRLRSIGRDMMLVVDGSRQGNGNGGSGGNGGNGVVSCPKCGRIAAPGWKYCASCGSELIRKSMGNEG